MLDYAILRRKDLVKAAKAKHVVVTSSRASRPPSKADYVKALHDFDVEYMATHPFRFMDLSPELRNHVNEEGTNILYGDNLVEVKIWPTEIQAHGLKCGSYDPFGWGSLSAVADIEWPQMLRKVQWVRVSLPPDSIFDGAFAVADGRPIIQQILYSFCSFLSSKNQLRSAEIDLEPLRLNDSSDHIPHFAWPLTMLGELKAKTIRVSESETVNLSDTATSQHNSFTDPALLQNALSLLQKAKHYERLSHTSHVEDVPSTSYRSPFGRVRNSMQRQLSRDDYIDAAWEKQTAQAVEEMVRVLGEDLTLFVERETAHSMERQESIAQLTADWMAR